MNQGFRRAIAVGLASAFLAQAGVAIAAADGFVRVPKGTTFRVEVGRTLSTGGTRQGEQALFKIANDIKARDAIVIPSGRPVTGVITRVKQPNPFHRAELHIRLEEIQLAGGASLPVKAGVLKLGSPEQASRASDTLAGTIGWSAIAGGFGWFMGSHLCIPGMPGPNEPFPCDGRKSKAGGMLGLGMGVASTIRMVANSSSGPEFVLSEGTVLEVKLERAIDISRP